MACMICNARNIVDKVNPTGRKATADFKPMMAIAFDEYLPKWNYSNPLSVVRVGQASSLCKQNSPLHKSIR
ncbi:MAG: hypothetical protein VKJ24_13045, partial [Synechococcales bacterium]|nr:hypothetical protein [Synechococcales bacterium]